LTLASLRRIWLAGTPPGRRSRSHFAGSHRCGRHRPGQGRERDRGRSASAAACRTLQSNRLVSSRLAVVARIGGGHRDLNICRRGGARRQVLTHRGLLNRPRRLGHDSGSGVGFSRG
jgi:hypothetical protein